MGNKGVLFFSYFGFPTMFPPALLQVEEAHVSPRLAALIASVGQPCSKADAQALAAAAGFESQGRPHKQAGAQQRLPLEPLMSHCLPAPHCALCSAAHCERNSLSPAPSSLFSSPLQAGPRRRWRTCRPGRWSGWCSAGCGTWICTAQRSHTSLPCRPSCAWPRFVAGWEDGWLAGTVAAGALADPSACILHLAPNAPNATAWGAIAVSAPAVAAAAVETFGWPVPCRALPPALLQSYERLEFLGDSVLGLAGRTLLMRRCPDSDEVRGHGRKAGGVLGLGPLPNRTALHCTALHCTALHCTAPLPTPKLTIHPPTAALCCAGRDDAAEQPAGVWSEQRGVCRVPGAGPVPADRRQGL